MFDCRKENNGSLNFAATWYVVFCLLISLTEKTSVYVMCLIHIFVTCLNNSLFSNWLNSIILGVIISGIDLHLTIQVDITFQNPPY